MVHRDGASRCGDRVKSARRSRAIHYKINAGVCLYATLIVHETQIALLIQDISKLC